MRKLRRLNLWQHLLSCLMTAAHLQVLILLKTTALRHSSLSRAQDRVIPSRAAIWDKAILSRAAIWDRATLSRAAI